MLTSSSIGLTRRYTRLDGVGVIVTRRAGFEDHALVNALHRRCSADAVYQRYLAPRPQLTAPQWRHLTARNRAASFVSAPLGDGDHLVAVLNLVRHAANPRVWDLGLLVHDDFQRQGLGQVLLDHALAHIRDSGGTALTATTLSGNRGMLRLLRAAGAGRWRLDGPTVESTIELRAS
jgi:GNAT superfamily N-acetyltransferase